MKVNIKGTIIPSEDQWIYDLFGIDATSPQKVDQIIDMAKGEDLEVIINSPGGDVYAGSEIYTKIKEYESVGNVVTKIVGIAASAASVIAMAGKTMISPTAQLMIHNASALAVGDHRDMKHGSDFLRGWDKSITNAYMLKSGMSQEELLALMDEETWFNAQEAKEKGLVDEIMFEDGNQPRLVAGLDQAQVIPQKVIDKVKNETKKNEQNGKILNGLTPQNKVLVNEKTKNKSSETEDETMDLEKLKAEHPELYNQIKKEGHEEGVKAENERIKQIEDLGIPGSEELINEAKFETGVKAEVLAISILKAQKEQGSKYLNNRKEETEELNNVDGAEAPENNESEEAKRKEAAKGIAEHINNKRGGRNNG